MSRRAARGGVAMVAVITVISSGLFAPTTAGAQTAPAAYVLPGGADNFLFLSLPDTQISVVRPGALIRANAPTGIDFSNATVTATQSDAPNEPQVLTPTVSDGGRSIEWTVPGDTPAGLGLVFELTDVAAPGYSAFELASILYLGVDVAADGVAEDVIELGLGAEFYESAPVTFPAGEPVTWTLPSASTALDQLEAGTGVDAQFDQFAGAYIPEGDAGEDIPLSVSTDGQSVTGRLPFRVAAFPLFVFNGSEEPPINDLHSLFFAYESVTVAGDFPCAVSEQVIGAIRDRYVSLGGPCGLLGDPLTAELATPVKFGRFNHFEGGSIYWSPATGAWEVHGAIRETWSRLGWENGAVGFPVTNELPTPTKFGAFNHFQSGSIYWSPATGAREVRGAIRETWSRLGWENGAVGFPLTDELPTPHKFGAFNHFQSGSIYWSPATGAREVRGAIRDTWSRQGWENGALGFPTSDEYAIPGGRRSDFQGGFITWTPAGGTVVRRNVFR